MKDTFAALPLRSIANPREFAASHYSTLKKAMLRGGAEVPGYQPLAYSPKETFIWSNKGGSELQLNCMTVGAAYGKGEFLQIDARVQPGLWKKEMISVTHVAGKGSLITKLVMPRAWSTQKLEIHQVNLPDDSSIPPTYSKRVGPDFSLNESSPGQADYPRQQVWDMFDAAKEMDQMLRIPGRSLDSLAGDFDQALGGVRPPYWDGETKV